MKKRCPYCRGIVEIKKEEIAYVKDNGRGVLCDLCGSFIGIPKQVNGNVRLSSSYIGSGRGYGRGYRRKRRMAQRTTLAITVFLGSLIVFSCFFIFYPSLYPYPVSEQRTDSIFIFYDNQTGIDVSDSVEMSMMFPKEDSIFDNIDDANNISKFETAVIAKASDIQIDIRHISYFYVQIDPLNKTTYRNDYHLIVGGINYQFCFYLFMEV